MSITRQPVSRLSLVSLVGATAGAILCLAPANAQTFRSEGPLPEDPLIQYAEQIAPRNEFFINGDGDVEVIRFKTPRDLELCARRAHNSPDGRIAGYPVKVTWDTDSAVVMPGNCLAFDARRVTVSAASRLPEDVVLQGTFRVTK